MKIIVDVMGADKPASEIVEGAVSALDGDAELELLLVGKEAEIKKALDGIGCTSERVAIIDAELEITMDDDPFSVVKTKRASSMYIALRALADGKGDALVSCGNTGALFVGATTVIKPLKPVRRGALATFLPYDPPLLLIDSGANATMEPEYYHQFAVLGAAYCTAVLGLESPRVGLLNNGSEEQKGTPEVMEAYRILKESDDVNFVGNIEGKFISYGKCDVLVTDGFTGNIVLKYSEGLGTYFFRRIKAVFSKNLVTKLAGALVMKHFRALRREFSAETYGGAPILGIRKPVIKAHGASGSRTIRAAVLRAADYAASGAIEKMERTLSKQ